MATLEEFSAIVLDIQTAALDIDHWHIALGRLKRAMGASSAGLMVARPSARTLTAVSAGFNPLAASDYHNYYALLDPIATKLESLPVGTMLSMDMVTSVQARAHSEFFQDWANPYDMGDGIFLTLLRDGSQTSGMYVAAPQGDSSFGTKERMQLLQALAPHFRQAIRLQSLVSDLHSEYERLRNAFDCLPNGIVLLKENGAVLIANKSAISFCSYESGLSISSHGIKISSKREHANFHRLVRNAGCVNADGLRLGGMLRMSRRHKRDLIIHVTPVAPESMERRGFSAAVLVVIADIGRDLSSTRQHLQPLFDLTPAEANVAILASDGHGLQHVADELGVTLSTVRIHLQRVFEKTDTHRQAELARLLLQIDIANSPEFSGPMTSI